MADESRDDEILGKAYDAKLMRRLLKYLRPYKKYLVSAILLNILVASLPALRRLCAHVQTAVPASWFRGSVSPQSCRLWRLAS